MSSSEKEIMEKLKQKELLFSLPDGILEQIYNEERMVLYKGRKRNMDEKILKIINQYASTLDSEKLREVLEKNDTAEN
ncbi:MAG: hypothetical protein HOD60_02045 [Candidatus Nitrosopelagicus sp.]|mgnify:FL=1|nr:hypothetical protein [Candidatus Nitrosopelagicus sp.]